MRRLWTLICGGTCGNDVVCWCLYEFALRLKAGRGMRACCLVVLVQHHPVGAKRVRRADSSALLRHRPRTGATAELLLLILTNPFRAPVRSLVFQLAVPVTRGRSAIHNIDMRSRRRAVGACMNCLVVPKDVRERILNHGRSGKGDITDGVKTHYE